MGTPRLRYFQLVFTPKERRRRQRIAASQRERWAGRHALDAEIAGRLFRLIVGRGGGISPREEELLPILLDRAIRCAPERERRSLERFRAVLAAGRRIKVGTYPADVVAGDALTALDRARDLLADDAALRRATDAL